MCVLWFCFCFRGKKNQPLMLDIWSYPPFFESDQKCLFLVSPLKPSPVGLHTCLHMCSSLFITLSGSKNNVANQKQKGEYMMYEFSTCLIKRMIMSRDFRKRSHWEKLWHGDLDDNLWRVCLWHQSFAGIWRLKVPEGSWTGKHQFLSLKYLYNWFMLDARFPSGNLEFMCISNKRRVPVWSATSKHSSWQHRTGIYHYCRELKVSSVTVSGGTTESCTWFPTDGSTCLLNFCKLYSCPFSWPNHAMNEHPCKLSHGSPGWEASNSDMTVALLTTEHMSGGK